MNFHEYLNRQKTEDRRAFIIHFPPKSGKTQFARRVCATRWDVYLLDLQTHFLEQPEPMPIGRFGFSDLKGLLLGLEVPQSVIIVDNLDFLFNTWDNRNKTDFANWLRRQLRSPSVTAKTFIFIFQSDPFLETMQLKNSHQESRVQPLNAFDSL